MTNPKPGLAVLDTREPKVRRDAVRAKLPTDMVEERKLDQGDYWFIGKDEELLIESKTLQDLESSFFSRYKGGGCRLDSQVAKLLKWQKYQQTRHKQKNIRVRLMIEGSYLQSPLMMRLMTYQALGLEVIWGEDLVRMLVNQYKATVKGGHRLPRVSVGRVGTDKLPLRDQVLLPLLNKKQREVVFQYCSDIGDVIHHGREEMLGWPHFGPKTIQRLKEGLIWGGR